MSIHLLTDVVRLHGIAQPMRGHSVGEPERHSLEQLIFAYGHLPACVLANTSSRSTR
jgi:hypothetical protein